MKLLRSIRATICWHLFGHENTLMTAMRVHAMMDHQERRYNRLL